MTAARMHPSLLSNDAVQALAERATHINTAQDRRLDRIEEMVREVHGGRTPHQRHVLAVLRSITFHMQALAMQKLVLPAAVILSAFFFGGFAAVMVLEHFH